MLEIDIPHCRNVLDARLFPLWRRQANIMFFPVNTIGIRHYEHNSSQRPA